MVASDPGQDCRSSLEDADRAGAVSHKPAPCAGVLGEMRAAGSIRSRLDERRRSRPSVLCRIQTTTTANTPITTATAHTASANTSHGGAPTRANTAATLSWLTSKEPPTSITAAFPLVPEAGSQMEKQACGGRQGFVRCMAGVPSPTKRGLDRAHPARLHIT